MAVTRIEPGVFCTIFVKNRLRNCWQTICRRMAGTERQVLARRGKQVVAGGQAFEGRTQYELRLIQKVGHRSPQLNPRLGWPHCAGTVVVDSERDSYDLRAADCHCCCSSIGEGAYRICSCEHARGRAGEGVVSVGFVSSAVARVVDRKGLRTRSSYSVQRIFDNGVALFLVYENHVQAAESRCAACGAYSATADYSWRAGFPRILV